jgi:predicted RecB family nuclease
LDAGIAFEARVFEDLRRRHRGAVLIDVHAGRQEAISATVAAMDGGAPLILGGWLPDDPAGARTGRPDILVAVAGGYLPADVKGHRSLQAKPTASAPIAALDQPGVWQAVRGWSAATPYRLGDGMQLAHYTRLLQACGRHPGPGMLYGAVLGTTVVETVGTQKQWVFAWHDLGEPLGFTYSRSRGKARRSLLARYDHEHGFRAKVARAARQAAAGSGELVVDPVGQPQCRTCPYQDRCAQQMGPEDASLALDVGGLDVREWVALRQMGIRTVAELAAVRSNDPDFMQAYYREVSHRGPEQVRARLADAAKRAAMICDGVAILRVADGPVPVADLEIDCDIEWSAQGRVYLWGARVRLGRDESTAVFVEFADWAVDDDDSERALALRFVTWIRGLRDLLAMAGRSVRVFHWSAAEPSRLRRILGVQVADLVDPVTGVFTDLEAVFTSNFVSVRGSSIKVVAPQFGFTWSAPDAGGAISQRHLDTMRAGGQGAAAARDWLLAYNRDDTAALAAIRDGIAKTARVQPEGVSGSCR